MAKRRENWELLEAVGDAMDSVMEAIDSLRGFEEFEEWHSALTDIMEEMEPKKAEYEAIDAAEYEEEIEGLRRQYYRDVL